MPTKLYQLTDEDRAIFKKAWQTKNINWFTNYYLRSPDSGTWWRPVEQQELDRLFVPEFVGMAMKLKSGYDQLLSGWMELGKPDFFIDTGVGKYETLSEQQYKNSFALRRYRVVQEYEYSTPTFHDNHGFLFLPWQNEMHQTPQEIRVIIGGVGSGKTLAAAVEMLFWAATLKNFRGFGLAPFAKQADEVYDILIKLVEDTVYAERFLVSSPKKPMKHLVIGHSDIGKNSTIECYPLDKSEKILTLTADTALIDQAEQLDSIEAVLGDVGTRFRGQTAGRQRVGKISFVANSGDNTELWDLYDEAEEDPALIWSASPHSVDNVYLTIRDMLRYQRSAGRTQEERERRLAGKRPIGSGERFPQSSILNSHAEWMDDLMESKIQELGEDNFEWKRKSEKRIGIHEWQMPPEKDAIYYVTADPGWKNPPFRDSAVIGVWKVDDFPFIPAHLVAFSWVFGDGKPDPWINKFTEYVVRYKAYGLGGYDSTGSGSAYAHMTEIMDLGVSPINLGGSNKLTYLTILQKMMAQGLLQMPNVGRAFWQLARYENPEPAKLKQDIVMMLLVTAAILQPLWSDRYTDENKQKPIPDIPEFADRYSRSIRERYGATVR